MRLCPACDTRTEREHCPRDGRPTVEEQRLRPQGGSDPLIGYLLEGRYRVESRLGSGGFGSVYVARHVETGGRVAVKLLRTQALEDEQSVKRFYIEAQNTHQLQHPNTIRVSDFGRTDDGVLYLMMEFVEGKPLSKVLKQEGVLDPGRVVRILEQVLKSLGEAHQRQIVHRDVKPDNIMLIDQFGERDFVKVLDFGISRALEGTGASTHGPIGTPRYMAPEQWRGEGVDPRADLYALGGIAYRMLVGSGPFEVGDAGPAQAMAFMRAHLEQPLEPVLQARPGACPEPLARLVERMLAKDPDERPQTALELVEALQAIRARDPLPDAADAASGPAGGHAPPPATPSFGRNAPDGGAPAAAPADGSGATVDDPAAAASGVPEDASGTHPQSGARPERSRTEPVRRRRRLVPIAAVAAALAVGIGAAFLFARLAGGQREAASGSAAETIGDEGASPGRANAERVRRAGGEPRAGGATASAGRDGADRGAGTASDAAAGAAPRPRVALRSEPEGVPVRLASSGRELGVTPTTWKLPKRLAERVDDGEPVTLVFESRRDRVERSLEGHVLRADDPTLRVTLDEGDAPAQPAKAEEPPARAEGAEPSGAAARDGDPPPAEEASASGATPAAGGDEGSAPPADDETTGAGASDEAPPDEPGAATREAPSGDAPGRDDGADAPEGSKDDDGDDDDEPEWGF